MSKNVNRTIIIVFYILGSLAVLGALYNDLRPVILKKKAELARAKYGCTPFHGDSFYMTKEISLYVRDNARQRGNLSGCIPRKAQCVLNNDMWLPDQSMNYTEDDFTRTRRPLPYALTGEGLKEAILTVLKYKNGIYAQRFKDVCPLPVINIVEGGAFAKKELETDGQRKIQVDIQRILIGPRNFYLVSFYDYRRAFGEIKQTNMGGPWLVMEDVKIEEVMYELMSVGGLGISIDTFGLKLGTYPSKFQINE